MKKLLYALALLPALVFGQVANDLIWTQRKPDNSGNIQRNVSPTANAALGVDTNKLPVALTAFTQDSATGAAAVTASGTNQDITLTPSGTGKIYGLSASSAYFIAQSSNTTKGSAFRFINKPGSTDVDWEVGVGGLGIGDASAGAFYYYDNKGGNYRLFLGPKSRAAWGATGAGFAMQAVTFTDTSSSGTVATAVANSFAIPTFAASSATTYTHSANVYIAGPPTSGTNVTQSNTWALWVAAGNSRFEGNIFSVHNAASVKGIEVQNASTSGYAVLTVNNNGTSGRSFAVGSGGSAAGSSELQSRFYIYDNTAALTRLTLDSAGVFDFRAGAITLGTGASTITGGAGNMTITAGTGNSRTLTFQTTTSGGTATTALVLGTAQQATFSGAVIATPQALSGAGAVNVTTSATYYTSTGALQALTLADGTAEGQVKYIVHKVDGGSGVLTPTTKIGYTTITFTNVGDSCTLIWTSAGWAIVGVYGAVVA